MSSQYCPRVQGRDATNFKQNIWHTGVVQAQYTRLGRRCAGNRVSVKGAFHYKCRPPAKLHTSIVAVHGLNGDARQTWSSRKNRVCWLNHPNFLPKFLEDNGIRARVLTWGYNSSFSSLTGSAPIKDGIMLHAQSLVSHLSSDRRVRFCQQASLQIPSLGQV